MCHPLAGNFEGNPMDVFSAYIGLLEYGPGEMPRSSRMYGGRYSVIFTLVSACCVLGDIPL